MALNCGPLPAIRLVKSVRMMIRPIRKTVIFIIMTVRSVTKVIIVGKQGS